MVYYCLLKASRVIYLFELLLEFFPVEDSSKDPLQSPRLLSILNELAALFLNLFHADILKVAMYLI